MSGAIFGARGARKNHNLKVTCSACRVSAICLPAFLETCHSNFRSEDFVGKHVVLSRKDQIFDIGEPFEHFHVVQSGSALTYMLAATGDMQIMGFFLPGEVFGLDGINHGKHIHAARAMETSSICQVHFELIKSSQVLQSYVNHVMSAELEREQELVYMLAQRTAEERIASFLLNISARYARCKLSATCFRLPMARNEMANYLGLAIETVSRTLTHLQHESIISVSDKEVEIIDFNALCGVALPVGDETCRYSHSVGARQ